MDFRKNIFGALSLLLLFLAGAKVSADYKLLAKGPSSKVVYLPEEKPDFPIDRFELAMERIANSVLVQEYSGPGLVGTHRRAPLLIIGVHRFGFTPSFYKADQRKLIFQYLYPFHFFF